MSARDTRMACIRVDGLYQRIANPGGLRLGSDVSNTPLHVLKKSQKKSCHTHGNCYKRRNSSSLGRIHAKIYAISATNFTVSSALNFSGGVNAACRFRSASERSFNPFLRFRRNGHATLPRGLAVQCTRGRDRRGDDAVPRQRNTWGPIFRRQYLTRGGSAFERACGCRPEPYLAGYPQKRPKSFGHRDSYALVARYLCCHV